jgi:hypothetical protein
MPARDPVESSTPGEPSPSSQHPVNRAALSNPPSHLLQLSRRGAARAARLAPAPARGPRTADRILVSASGPALAATLPVSSWRRYGTWASRRGSSAAISRCRRPPRISGRRMPGRRSIRRVRAGKGSIPRWGARWSQAHRGGGRAPSRIGSTGRRRLPRTSRCNPGCGRLGLAGLRRVARPTASTTTGRLAPGVDRSGFGSASSWSMRALTARP